MWAWSFLLCSLSALLYHVHACDETISVTAGSAQVSSQNMIKVPVSYSLNEIVCWNITVASGYNVKLSWNSSNVSPSTDCRNASVKIILGCTSRVLKDESCSGSSGSLPESMTLYGEDCIHIEFVSQLSASDSFQLDFHVLAETYPKFPEDFRFSGIGPIGGMECTSLNEPEDPHFWYDNYWCWNQRGRKNPEIAFSHSGKLTGKTCTKVVEPSDPNGWDNNYLCHSPNAPYKFRWTYWDPVPGLACIGWPELADPHFWYDNHMCEENSVSCGGSNCNSDKDSCMLLQYDLPTHTDRIKKSLCSVEQTCRAATDACSLVGDSSATNCEVTCAMKDAAQISSPSFLVTSLISVIMIIFVNF